MADTPGGRPKNALMKRHDQLEKWKVSELSKVTADRSKAKNKIKFNSGCVFLASCSSGDTDEVKTLLDKGADINYANVDGLTALHQAVIDEKLEMVEFLIENGADIEAQDNEGWTPLHAAASCGFTDISKFLIDSGANVSACNNEGELPIDLAEEEDMEELLQKEIKKQGIDVEDARNEEERQMVRDANQMLNSRIYKDRRHHATGATPLHVAASKGYIKCMTLLIQAGAEVNALDYDSWTALHAASHWGHKEAAEILAEALADMEIKNKLGQTCMDLAEDDMIKCLEELKKKQASIKKEKRPSAPRIESKAPPPLKRRASVTRINASDRNMLLHQDMAAERKQLEAKIHGDKDKETDRLSSRRTTDNSAHESGSYMTPAKDDEAETVRRTKAKRERSTRRSTQGVTAEDIESAYDTLRKGDGQEEEEKPASRVSSTSSTDRYTRPLSTGSLYSSDRSKYDSTTKTVDTPSSRSDRLERSSSTSSYMSKSEEKAATTPCQNCKKLFEDKEEQITQLNDQLKDRALEVAELKALRKTDRLETKSVDNDKRERRALERRVSELEEELKKMEKLKADNQRLKDENGALVRVISKLSK